MIIWTIVIKNRTTTVCWSDATVRCLSVWRVIMMWSVNPVCSVSDSSQSSTRFCSRDTRRPALYYYSPCPPLYFTFFTPPRPSPGPGQWLWVVYVWTADWLTECNVGTNQYTRCRLYRAVPLHGAQSLAFIDPPRSQKTPTNQHQADRFIVLSLPHPPPCPSLPSRLYLLEVILHTKKTWSTDNMHAMLLTSAGQSRQIATNDIAQNTPNIGYSILIRYGLPLLRAA